MENISLYEMTTDLENLLSDDEVSEEQKEEISKIILELIKNKSSNIIKILRNYEIRIENIKEEQKRLLEYRKSQEKAYEKLTNYLIDNLQRANLKKIQTDFGKVALRKNPVSVEVVDINLLPRDCIVEEIKLKADKKILKEKLLNNENIEGAFLIENKYSLSVK